MSSEKIRQAIQGLATGPGTSTAWHVVAKVESVDWDKRKCKCKDSNGAEYFDVRLRAVLDDSKKGFCIKPKVNSLVLLAPLNNNNLTMYVSQFTEVDSIELVADNDVLKIDVVNGEFVFNGGNNKGMVKLVELVQKLNDLESYVRNFAALFNSHTHPVSGTATSTPATTYTAQLQGTQQSDLENTKVKH